MAIAFVFLASVALTAVALSLLLNDDRVAKPKKRPRRAVRRQPALR